MNLSPNLARYFERRIAALGDMFELGPQTVELQKKVFAHALGLGLLLVIDVGEISSQCLYHLVYKNVASLKKRFRVDVSAGDRVPADFHAKSAGLIPDPPGEVALVDR